MEIKVATEETLYVRTEERWAHFNDTTGAIGCMTKRGPTGAHCHPDRCTCQGTDPTPHKHRDEPPHSCARCLECSAYEAAGPEPKNRATGCGVRLLGQDMLLLDVELG